MVKKHKNKKHFGKNKNQRQLESVEEQKKKTGFSWKSMFRVGRSQRNKNDKDFIRDFNDIKGLQHKADMERQWHEQALALAEKMGGKLQMPNGELVSNFSKKEIADFKAKFKFNKSRDDEKLYFCALGGLNTFGQNMYLYGYKGDWIIIDCGENFSDVQDEGFLEKIIPDTAFLQAIQDKIVGCIITHVHLDHIGSVLNIIPKFKIPIYGSPIVKEFLQANAGEYGNPRYKFVEINPEGDEMQIGQFKTHFVHMTHSVLEAQMIAFEFDQGYVLHTGDYNLDYSVLVGSKPDTPRLKKMAEEKGFLAVIGDSTNAVEKGKTISQADELEELTKVAKSIKKGAIWSCCFASSTGTLKNLHDAAVAAGRTPILGGRSLIMFEGIGRKLGYLKGCKFESFRDAADLDIPDEKRMYILTGTQAEYYAAMTSLSRGKVFGNETKPGDTAIFSSRIIPGNEKEIYEVHNAFTRKGVKIISIKNNERIHASGHAAQEDIKELYSMLNPKAVIPMHGTHTHMVQNAKMAEDVGVKTELLLEDGDLVELDLPVSKFAVVDKVLTGRIFIENKQMITKNASTLKNRSRVKNNGSVFISYSVDKKGDLTQGFNLSTIGLIENDSTKHLLEEMEIFVKKNIMTMNKKDRLNLYKLKSATEIFARRYIKIHMPKSPLVIVHVNML